MVCKENVVSWFGNLSSYKRIDVMCTLLNMCLPFEIRYLGTYVEDRGKRDYNDLRDTEHHANNATELAELATLGLTDTRTRRKLVLYLALLQGCNYNCANVLYKCLANLDIQEVINSLTTTTTTGNSGQNDQNPLEELILLYTMALNHPAYTYEQKTTFGNIYLKLKEEDAKLNKLSRPCEPFPYKTDDRLPQDSLDFHANYQIIPTPIQQHYAGDMPMRNNPIVTGVPPGLTMPPPPGLCLPTPEQMALGGVTNPPGHLVHLGFPTINSVSPWSGQGMMVANQMMYQSGDIPAYSASPLVSRQSSPSQSRSPSRSNSPMGRRSNTIRGSSNTFDDRTSCQSTQSTPSTMTTSISNISNSQSSSSSVSSHGPNRNITCGPPRSAPPSTCSSVSYLRQNSLDSTTTTTNHQPPSRLRSSVSGDSLRETIGKEMPSLKNNLQNFSLEEIRRMSDDDLKDIGLPQNAVGQLRSLVRSQTATNGLSQGLQEKKGENPGTFMHQSVAEQSENEAGQGVEGSNEAPSTKAPPHLQDLHQPMHQHHHHHHNHPASVSGMRRFTAMPPSVETPAQMSVYHTQPPPMYATQNPCYACLTIPMAGMHNRYPRCNAQHMYCLTQLQALRLDPDNSRYCSQSSSSDSTGSRSPPETPPAAPWTSNNATTPNNDPSATSGVSTSDQIPSSSTSTTPYSAVVTASHQNPPSSVQQMTERPRSTKKNQTHMMRQKNQMINGSGGGGGGGGAVLSNMPHCVSAFPGPTSHPQMTFLPPGHFPTIRPNSGIYSSGFSPSMYSRSAYQNNYPPIQPNSEMLFPYPGAAASGTPPPPPPPLPATASQTYLPSTPIVTYPPTPTVQSTKISCYNCGSSSHLAGDCKDQTMEDLTKRAQYRLDYTVMKQPGESSHTDE